MSNVVHPAHYNQGKIEVWDAITDWQLDFLSGNVVKYIARAGKKGSELEDLKKAREYLNKKISLIEGEVDRPVVDAEFEEPNEDARTVFNLLNDLTGRVYYIGDEALIDWEDGRTIRLSRSEFREAFGKGLRKQEAWLKWNTIDTTGTTSAEDQLAEDLAKD